MKITLKPIRPKGKMFDTAQFERDLEAAKKEVVAGIRVDFVSTVASWKTNVKFGTTRRGTDWYVSTKNVVYSYVNEGTRPHLIKPRFARRLRFYRTGFQAKTRVNVIGSGPGRQANRDLTLTKVVHHPGTKARNFSQKIREKWQRVWQDKVAQAIRRAAGRR